MASVSAGYSSAKFTPVSSPKRSFSTCAAAMPTMPAFQNWARSPSSFRCRISVIAPRSQSGMSSDCEVSIM